MTTTENGMKCVHVSPAKLFDNAHSRQHSVNFHIDAELHSFCL